MLPDSALLPEPYSAALINWARPWKVRELEAAACVCTSNPTCGCLRGATAAPPEAPTQPGTPFMPLAIMNGHLQAAPNRHAPTTDINTAPRLFRHYVDASGFTHVQLDNGLHRRIGTGRVNQLSSFATYLSSIVPIIPGQTRDNYGGFHKHGIDPQSYATLVANGPGSQPVNPGGVRKIAADYYVNPYAGGG